MKKMFALSSDLSNYSAATLYTKEIDTIPFLSLQEEQELVQKWEAHNDVSAAHKLVTSHLKLVVKIAYSFKNYGLPMSDMISEGNIGLMKAVKKFKSSMGCRVSTYAIWWIRSAIQSYILKSWSLVKIATKSMRQKLFYNLSKSKQMITDGFTNVQKELDLSEDSGDARHYDPEGNASNVLSLNHKYGVDDSQHELIDTISSEDEISNDDRLLMNEDKKAKVSHFNKAMSKLSERERTIITKRKLAEQPSTLQSLSDLYGVSRERVRQIEERAMDKLKQYVQCNA